MWDSIPVWASVVLSVVAIWVSIWAVKRANSAQRESNTYQARLVALEEGREARRDEECRKAVLRGEIQHKGNGYRLYIINGGQAEARNIRVTMDDAFEGVDIYDNSPIPSRLDPGASVPYKNIFTNEGTPDSFVLPINLLWDDDFASGRTYTRELPLP